MPSQSRKEANGVPFWPLLLQSIGRLPMKLSCLQRQPVRAGRLSARNDGRGCARRDERNGCPVPERIHLLFGGIIRTALANGQSNAQTANASPPSHTHTVIPAAAADRVTMPRRKLGGEHLAVWPFSSPKPCTPAPRKHQAVVCKFDPIINQLV